MMSSDPSDSLRPCVGVLFDNWTELHRVLYVLTAHANSPNSYEVASVPTEPFLEVLLRSCQGLLSSRLPSISSDGLKNIVF